MKKNWHFYARLRCNKLLALCSERMSLQINDNNAWDNILIIISFKIVTEGPNTFSTFSEYNQQDAKFLNLFISVRRSTCFRRFFRPTPGAQNWTYSVRYWSHNYCYLLLTWMIWNCSYIPSKLAVIVWQMPEAVCAVLSSWSWKEMGTTVAQWLRCCATNLMVAGSSQLVSLEFFVDIKSFRSHHSPGVDSACNRNEYQEHFLGLKAAGA